MRIGVARADITPSRPVWLTGFGARDRQSEGVYHPLRTGAISLTGRRDEALIVAADLIGYGLAFAARAKLNIAEATGLLPRQIVLTATHTHGGPFFSPWAMPGEMDVHYAGFLHRQLVELALAARQSAIAGSVQFSRGCSDFGVNRRVREDPIDPDLDTLWFVDDAGRDIASLSIYGCHAVCFSDHRLGPDYPGLFCSEMKRQTGAPSFLAAGCGGDVNPGILRNEQGVYEQPRDDAVQTAVQAMAEAVLHARSSAGSVDCDDLRIATDYHSLPYANLPSGESLQQTLEGSNPLLSKWARSMLYLCDRGGLPRSCPHEIQILQLNPEFRILFFGGEILTQIGLRLKRELAPATTITVAYSNGLIAYIPNERTYDRGGYEVDGSHYYFLRPAPFARDVESHVIAKTQQMIRAM